MLYLEYWVWDIKRVCDVEIVGRKENLEDGWCVEGDWIINIVGMI